VARENARIWRFAPWSCSSVERGEQSRGQKQ